MTDNKVDWNVVGPKLLECLIWYVKEDEVFEGDYSVEELGGESWNKFNAYWLEGKRKAISTTIEAGGKIDD